MTLSTPSNGVARVCYAFAPCSLGWLLVAATDRGVCFTSLGDDPESLHKHLAARFPSAELLDDDPQLADWTTRLVALIEAPGETCDVPLDIRGTVFQRQVWAALSAIPPGTTFSYAEVARRIGNPKAARAVGHACGANPVAPIIPCHRVLSSDGSLGGYGWGLERKQALLAREATTPR